MKELLPLSDTITYIYLLFDTTYSNQFADSNRIRKPNQVGSGSLTKELPSPPPLRGPCPHSPRTR